jgi:hypothetical protein
MKDKGGYFIIIFGAILAIVWLTHLITNGHVVS